MRHITGVGGSSHQITLRNVGCYVGNEDPHPTLIYAIWHFSYTLLAQLCTKQAGDSEGRQDGIMESQVTEVLHHAIAACLYEKSVATVCIPLRGADLAEGPSVAGGGHAGSRQAHRILGSAGIGSACAAGFRPLPPCAQPGGVVITGGEPGLAGPAGAPSGTGHRSAVPGDRRNHRTPQGAADSGQRGLSGWGAVLPWSLREGAGSALGQPDVAGPVAVDPARVGPALSHCAGPSTRYHAARDRRHKTVTDWARQMLCCVRRWLPDRALAVVGDRGYGACWRPASG